MKKHAIAFAAGAALLAGAFTVPGEAQAGQRGHFSLHTPGFSLHLGDRYDRHYRKRHHRDRWKRRDHGSRYWGRGNHERHRYGRHHKRRKHKKWNPW